MKTSVFKLRVLLAISTAVGVTQGKDWCRKVHKKLVIYLDGDQAQGAGPPPRRRARKILEINFEKSEIKTLEEKIGLSSEVFAWKLVKKRQSEHLYSPASIGFARPLLKNIKVLRIDWTAILDWDEDELIYDGTNSSAALVAHLCHCEYPPRVS